MDFSTIQKKLDEEVYQTEQEFADDVLLVFKNAMLFNPPGEKVHDDARFLQEKFILEFLPHTMEGKDDPEAKVIYLNTLDKLLKSEHSAIFTGPVDANLYPDYYKIITQPMDLAEIRRKVEANEYPTPQFFHNDIRKIITNCLKFNKKGTFGYSAGRSFETAYQSIRKRGSGAASANAAGSASGSPASQNSPQIAIPKNDTAAITSTPSMKLKLTRPVFKADTTASSTPTPSERKPEVHRSFKIKLSVPSPKFIEANEAVVDLKQASPLAVVSDPKIEAKTMSQIQPRTPLIKFKLKRPTPPIEAKSGAASTLFKIVEVAPTPVNDEEIATEPAVPQVTD